MGKKKTTNRGKKTAGNYNDLDEEQKRQYHQNAMRKHRGQKSPITRYNMSRLKKIINNNSDIRQLHKPHINFCTKINKNNDIYNNDGGIIMSVMVII